MAWNGSGGFSRRAVNQSGPETWKNVEAAGRKIRTDDHDTHDEDLAQGIENCITRDGQNSPSANLPMNSKKHTSVADASNDDEYAAWGQVKSRTSGTVRSKDFGDAEGEIPLLQSGGLFSIDRIPNIPVAKLPDNSLLFWVGTRAEYAALTNPDQTQTLYFLSD